MRCIIVLGLLIGFGVSTAIAESSGGAAEGASNSLEQNGFVFSVGEDAEGVALSITPAQADMVRIFSIAEPNRVVIDIRGSALKRSIDLILSSNPIIEKIRLGAHSDKIRVVADIRGNDIPPANLVQSGDGIKVILPVSEERRAEFESTARAEAGPERRLPTDVEPGAAGPIEASIASPEPRVGQQLTAISFDRLQPDGDRVVRLVLRERPAFSFQKADPETYRLTLTNCSLAGAHLTFPLYPPDDFPGMTLVAARQTGKNTEVLVGVEHGQRIAPSTTGDSIIIRAVAAAPTENSTR